MSKHKSLISDYPTKGRVYASAGYCFFGFGLGPLLLTFFGVGFELTVAEEIWAQIIFYIVNAVAAICIFRRYLWDSFSYYVQLYFREFIARVADGVVLTLMVAGVVYGIGTWAKSPLAMQGVLPIVEVNLFALPSAIIENHLILGMICMVFITPFSTSLLYYATGFARTCSHNPVRAYLLMAFILAIPGIVNALTFWPWEEEIILYLVQLPIHLIACRTYQKADTIWAPIVSHMIVNLLASLMYLF